MSDAAAANQAALEAETRLDLAAAFRWAARLNFHEGVANHFSAAVSPDGSRFLLNPRGAHFSRITASSLVLLDAHDIPVAPLHDIASIFEDPHLAATGFFRTEQHPSEGCIRTMRAMRGWSGHS